MARVLVKDSTTELSTGIGIVTIPGEVKAYAGATAPTGFLFCHGQAVSRTTYSALYAILGNSHGSGDGLTTFNLPDYRGSFLRGLVNVTTATGTGTASGSGTFTAHGFNRTGFKVRLSSGTLSPLAASTDYYVIVVDANTLRFATTKANALAGTYIAITGANSAVLTQWEDPDYSSREKLTGGANATGMGSMQPDAFQNITGSVVTTYAVVRSSAVGALASSSTTGGGVVSSPSYATTAAAGDIDFDASSSPGARTSTETRSKNVLINYIIKY
jgi:microcystin-dependent protein